MLLLSWFIRPLLTVFCNRQGWALCHTKLIIISFIPYRRLFFHIIEGWLSWKKINARIMLTWGDASARFLHYLIANWFFKEYNPWNIVRNKPRFKKKGVGGLVAKFSIEHIIIPEVMRVHIRNPIRVEFNRTIKGYNLYSPVFGVPYKDKVGAVWYPQRATPVMVN